MFNRSHCNECNDLRRLNSSFQVGETTEAACGCIAVCGCMQLKETVTQIVSARRRTARYNKVATLKPQNYVQNNLDI